MAELNGVVVVDKPAGWTSHDAVLYVRKVLGARKAGHTGTLDPIATGVLPVCVNEATKLVPFFEKDSKDYRVVMLLGVKTDTLDRVGTVLERAEPTVGADEITRVLLNFIGDIEQVPPAYSAIKYRGKSLYQWARKGISVEIRPRKIHIHRLVVESIRLPYVTFFVSCSKGTYLRSLCSDAGEKMGCGACMADLRRLRSGQFHEESVVPIRQGEENETGKRLREGFIAIQDLLPGLKTIEADEELSLKLRKGHQPLVENISGNYIPSIEAGDVIKFVTSGNRLVALARMLYSSDGVSLLGAKEQFARIIRVFNVDS